MKTDNLMKHNQVVPLTGKEKVTQVCVAVREMIKDGRMEEAKAMICRTMQQYPDAALPHNLMGILLAQKGDHTAAMKHFRAAWALDPTFLPARKNLEELGGMPAHCVFAYLPEDCGGHGIKHFLFRPRQAERAEEEDSVSVAL